MTLKLNKQIKTHIADMAIRKTKEVDIPRLQMKTETPRYGKEYGYGLSVAFDTRTRIDSLVLDKAVIGTDYKFHNALELFEVEFKALTTFLKEASAARQTLLDAMAHYKSCKKMFAELPWTEEFYPESEKKPACNVVPVSTIAAANELMGL